MMVFYLAELKEPWNLACTLYFLKYNIQTATNRSVTNDEAQYWYDFLFYPALRAVVRKDILSAYPHLIWKPRTKPEPNPKPQPNPKSLSDLLTGLLLHLER
jgi:hypothetical protein